MVGVFSPNLFLFSKKERKEKNQSEESEHRINPSEKELSSKRAAGGKKPGGTQGSNG